MPRVLPLILLCAAAHAAEVAQFRAKNFGAEWRAARGGAALVAVHPATNGWAAAFADRGGVSFSATNGVASPLEFDPATTSAVARALIVADCTEARWRDNHSALVVSDTIRFDPSNCRPGRTNFLGAAWTSTHNPTNASDHAPGIVETDVFFGPLCPVAHDANLIRGYKHSPPPDIRNLVQVITSNPQDDETDHCIGILWTTNLVVRLDDLLDPSSIMEFDQRSFSVQTSAEATITSNTIEKIRKPDDLWPAVFHVELHSSGTPRVLDRCWIVVNNPQTKTLFDDWYSRHSSNTNWTLSLPAPPSSLILDSSGNASLPAEATQSWHSPKRISDGAYIHHAAVFEIRSYAVSGGYGHQATYDEEGQLITSTISAGTADYRSPTGALMFGRKEDHRVEDMLPFVRALQLDGNPILVANRLSILRENLPLNLNRPCLRQGTYTDKYIQLRPTLPTGTLP